MQKLKLGDRVRHIKTNQIGTISTIKKSKVVVSIGAVLLSCELSDLTLLGHKPPINTANTQKSVPIGQRKIDLHGLTTKEAEERLLNAINDAVLHRIAILEVIHGKGPGKLKSLLESLISSLGLDCRLVPDPSNYGHSFIYF